jgi:hypothetical protein
MQRSHLFLLWVIALMAIAMFDVRWEIIFACFALGVVGFVGWAIIGGRAQAKAYHRAVGQYAERDGTSFPSQERWRESNRFIVIAIGLLLVFMGGGVLAILQGNSIIGFLAFIPCVIFILVVGARQGRRQEEAWRGFAARHGLIYEPRSFSNRVPRIYGTYRKREVAIRILKRREPGSGFSPVPSRMGTEVRPGRRMRSSSRRSYTQITLSVDNPSDFYLLMRGVEVERSSPPDFARDLLEMTDLHQRLVAVSLGELALRRQKLYLEGDGIPIDLAELQFLLDLMCDLATAIETTIEQQLYLLN